MSTSPIQSHSGDGRGLLPGLPRVSSFMRLKNPRTGAENQEDSKSRTEGTKQLSSSPW